MFEDTNDWTTVGTFNQDYGEGVAKISFRTNSGVRNSSAAIIEMFTHRDGCAILHVSSDNLNRLRHFLEASIMVVDELRKHYNNG